MILSDLNAEQRDEFIRQQFKDIVSAHVVTIGDDDYARYAEQALTGNMIAPDDDPRGIEKFPRAEWATSQLMSYADQGPRGYYNPNESVIGEIDGLPLIFDSYQGAYMLRDRQTETIYEVWLSWPCYPAGWA